jgi:biopolymer transport protein ExbD
MARRQLDEINAGSMADIAFLLLIFFLVTTTMDFDQGIAKTLPQKPPKDMPDVILLDRNVLTIQANFNDELMVDDEPSQISDLKDKVIEFMKNEKDDENLPAMLTITKESCEENIRVLKQNILENPKSEQLTLWESDLKDWESRREAVLVVGSFDVIPKLSVISVQTDNGTSYEFYIKIQDAMKGAINDLRNEWCLKAYDKKYTDLKETDASDMEKIKIIRAIVPERIAEMEPRNIQEF